MVSMCAWFWYRVVQASRRQMAMVWGDARRKRDWSRRTGRVMGRYIVSAAGRARIFCATRVGTAEGGRGLAVGHHLSTRHSTAASKRSLFHPSTPASE